ncbi:serine hydroxymethyltransferase [Blochmannia endosymbiont of Camponotus (Colobopsis) obliquus]|uniref:serine hydroxymethyltransferase n=1 Tax=Blochmannia endosymbiont of Camponotus (Colobopsis) obliquus TaxID=1505597 RepID=UPI00061A6EF2|nr:serine hydroxymethyltransferase [Blochmannia endosymbiont of Camponotus (Colobopsis) obliquus]AKC60685.1 serine hydroxymethyltransferase [Blochmannia endosymbiont of Camponotus (Colobopsis) obliquus]
MNITDYDFELWQAIEKEILRQQQHVELIASENYASICVMKAQGTPLTNKYAEGYPGQRYYGGCEYVDIVERLGIDRAKKLFSADYANIQPHSGSQANYAVYSALLKPGDLILGMQLAHGGHLTHGSSVNFSGKLYKVVSYGVNDQGIIDYVHLSNLAKRYRPKVLVAGFSAYSRIIDWKKMREIADDVGSYLFVDMAHIAGLVAVGLYPSPIPYAHVVTATTHKTLAGPRGGLILASGGAKEFYKKLNSSVFPGCQGGPLMHVLAAKALAFREAMQPSFKNYQHQVITNAQIMANIFIQRGFKVVSNGTDSHLFLIDLINKNLTGKKVTEILSMANIIVNKNSVPNDCTNPSISSGIRIGTPAVTRRGFNGDNVSDIATWICDILENIDNMDMISSVKNKVLDICLHYPVQIN